MARRSALLTLFGVAVVVVALDQLTKAWALATLEGQPPVEVIGDWLRWSFATNSGAAFSLGTGNAWIFTLFAAAVIIAILAVAPKVANVWWAISLGLILGGGAGNFIDRIVREPAVGQGHVIDFIALPNWPVFNIADMAVVGGALLAVLLSLRGVEYRQAAGQQPDPVTASGGAPGTQ